MGNATSGRHSEWSVGGQQLAKPSRYDLEVADAVAEIDRCKSLFLTEIFEAGHNSLRVLIQEGLPVGGATPFMVGGTVISGATRIDVTSESRAFEVLWENYVAYSIRNESFVRVDHDEIYDGIRFRVYSKSNFIDYVARATFASNEYPGPTQHHELICEDHIIDVIALTAPRARRLR